jgi:EAL domain-containing protein (putative c-di-GMP-specific phosphodiesterase class I)
VSRSPHWREAVQAVASELGGDQVVSCGAREALVQIASGEHYSHLLLERGCADGLFDALPDLTASRAYTNTSLLLLGGSDRPSPSLAVIPSASRRTIRRALTSEPPPSNHVSPAGNGVIPATELHEAVRGTMIEGRYQPIVLMSDRKPVAFEALARLNHPVRGTLFPDRFIPQLEAAGLGLALTDSVCARVFADLNRPLLPGSHATIGLNFPLDVLLDPAALTMLEERRIAAGVPATRVVIELTESQPVQDLTALERSLEKLRALDYGIAIDDVGPAMSSIAPMLDLPFTCITLDKEFVRQSSEDPDTLAFLVSITQAAQSRGLTVVAEGVETQELWNRMHAVGVDKAQGFLVARPLLPAAIPIWLDAWQGDNSGLPRN